MFFFMIVQYRVLILKYCFEYYNGILNIFLLLDFFIFWGALYGIFKFW